MARTFSMATVFRMAQSGLLRDFLTQIGLGPVAETVPWDAISGVKSGR